MTVRQAVIAITLSAGGLVALINSESYTGKAVIPVKGDVPTIGFGTTAGVKLGDEITPPVALERAYREVRQHEDAIKTCVKVPLAQSEYDAALQLSYNIGKTAFCGSTVVKRWNAGDYAGGCEAFTMWNKVKGREVRGLTLRRERERRLCLGLY